MQTTITKNIFQFYLQQQTNDYFITDGLINYALDYLKYEL